MKKTDKKILLASILFCSLNLNAFSAATAMQKFIKGNLNEKTVAVREASGEEAYKLSNTAIDFCIESHPVLGNDRELDSLAVAAVLSLSPDYIKNLNSDAKLNVMKKIENLFSTFNASSTVRIAVISKVRSLSDIVDVSDFVAKLNDYLQQEAVSTNETAVIKAVINALQDFGNKDSFIICYTLLNNSKFSSYNEDLEQACSSLIPQSMNEVLGIISQSNMTSLTKIYDLVQKNTKLSKKNLCEISENVTLRAILYMDNFSNQTHEQQDMQLKALTVLSENKWTVSSKTAVNYFMNAKKQYQAGSINESFFCDVIACLPNIAPIDSVVPLSDYLEELNAQTEKGEKVSIPVVLSVIKTLGLIGDKTAFDSLLAVTYIPYPESVLSSAREALSGLRWQ